MVSCMVSTTAESSERSSRAITHVVLGYRAHHRDDVARCGAGELGARPRQQPPEPGVCPRTAIGTEVARRPGLPQSRLGEYPHRAHCGEQEPVPGTTGDSAACRRPAPVRRPGPGGATPRAALLGSRASTRAARPGPGRARRAPRSRRRPCPRCRACPKWAARDRVRASRSRCVPCASLGAPRRAWKPAIRRTLGAHPRRGRRS